MWIAVRVPDYCVCGDWALVLKFWDVYDLVFRMKNENKVRRLSNNIGVTILIHLNVIHEDFGDFV